MDQIVKNEKKKKKKNKRKEEKGVGNLIFVAHIKPFVKPFH